MVPHLGAGRGFGRSGRCPVLRIILPFVSNLCNGPTIGFKPILAPSATFSLPDCRASIDLAPAAPTNRSLSEPRSSAGPTSPEQMPFGVISIGYDRMPRVEHPRSATNLPVRKFILGLS